ncbi:hypothetical protein BDM02DRAFT_3271660, partial [Thelephora ganbajun]
MGAEPILFPRYLGWVFAIVGESADKFPPATTYPPDIICFVEGSRSPLIFKAKNCSVTDNAVIFLNLTGPDFRSYVTAYCLNPPPDDICPFGFCPNPDVAGSLVRIANYVTGFCLAVLTFYSPRHVKAAFWSQALVTYSLLIACGISLVRGELTRFHSVIFVSIVCSPVNVYFSGYSIRAFWSFHRLDAVLGKKQYARRAMVLLSVGIWTAILIYAYLPQQHTKFAQDTCRGSIVENVFLGAPFIFAWALAIVAIFRRRKDIWPPEGPAAPKLACRRTIVTHYPFLQFLSVVAIPTAYWVGIVEVGVLGSQDVAFSLMFGQVLAVFVAVPPIIELAHLTPELWRWLINPSWVRYITRRPVSEIPDPEEIGTPNSEFVDWQNNEKKGTIDSQSSFTTEQPWLGRTKQPDSPKEVTEYHALLGDHPTVVDLSAPSTEHRALSEQGRKFHGNSGGFRMGWYSPCTNGCSPVFSLQ